MHTGILLWQRGRYFKLSVVALALALLLFLSQGGAQPPNGGTWQGYVLGTVGAMLVVWLSLLGVRKRRYRSTLGTVQGWTSAHVYLGSALLIIASLHSAWQFGWNVHTLAYGLMCLVVLSGMFGLYVYLHLPAQLASNRAGSTRQECLQGLGELDRQALALASKHDAQTQSLVASAIELTDLGGGMWAQLSGRDRSRLVLPPPLGNGKAVANTGQSWIISHLASRIPGAAKQAQVSQLNDLLAVFGKRQQRLQLLRRDIRLQAWLQVWLFVHIPLTLALLAALLVHIVTVFVYW